MPTAATSPASRWPPLAAPAAAVAAGIVADRQWPIAAEIAWLLAAIAWMLWWLAHRSERRWLAAAMLLISAAAIGAAWGHARWHLYPAREIGRYADLQPQPATVRAEALTEPIWVPAPPPSAMRTGPQGDESELLVRVTHIRQGADWRAVSGRARLTVEGHLLGVRAGDSIAVATHLVEPTPPMNPGAFDYGAWLRKDRQLCELRAGFPECVRVVSPGGNGPRAWLSRARGAGNGYLWEYVGERRGALAATLLLNDRQQLDRRRKDSFFHTGTIHLLAISGMHVAILISAIYWVARWGAAPRRLTLIAGAAVAVLYALLTDAQPPVLRSAILVILLGGGQLLGRRSLSFNSLAAAGLMVMAINPAELFQVGTQLSFLAVATLSVIARSARRERDPLDQLIAQSRPWPVRIASRFVRWLWGIWLTGLIVWLVTLPLILYQFHLASPIALLLNPVFILPVAVALLAGFGVLLLGWLFPAAATFCGWICDVSLGFVEWCIDRTESWPGLPVAMAAWSTPEWVIMSAGDTLDVSESTRAFTAAGAQVFHTAHDGAITFTVDKDEIRATPFRANFGVR